MDNQPLLPQSDSEYQKPKVRRTRTGCQTCRTRKVKCDELRPICTQCRKGSRSCVWSVPEPQRSRAPRRPNATACDSCREKKLKCVGAIHDGCEKCKRLGLECVRSRRDTESGSLPHPHHFNTARGPPTHSLRPHLSGLSFEGEVTAPMNQTSSGSTPLGQLPVESELYDLIQLYFSTVHHFGFFAFIHPIHFERLLAKENAPRELTFMMIASAMRFAAAATPENLAKADAWADAAIGALLPRIYQGYGAVQLMALLLAQHYDNHRGKFTSAYLLGANCTRMTQMMSLHTLDRIYPADFPNQQSLSPLLSREPLRRLAWCTFYLDSMADGGRYGSQTVDEHAYRLQLPCDEESFLGNDRVITEPLFPGQIPGNNIIAHSLSPASLDMSAYLLRAAAARRRALHFAFRASYQEQTVEQLSADLRALQDKTEEVFDALPRRFHFSPENIILHHRRLTTFVLLHVLRQNLFIILGRAALQIYLRDPAKATLVSQVRRNRITRALAVADVISEGLKHAICFDPHIGIQAYVALEILLFEPRRLANEDPSTDLKAPEPLEAISHLLTVIRDLAGRSVFIKHLRLEAIHRAARCDCTNVLTKEDLTLIRSKHPLVDQDVAEYDFRDHREAKRERLSKRGRIPGQNVPVEATDEVLLDDSSGPTSPDLDRMEDTRGARPSASGIEQSILHPLPDLGADADIDSYIGPMHESNQPWREDLVEPENADHLFSPLNWQWPFEEWGGQVGELSGFSGLL